MTAGWECLCEREGREILLQLCIRKRCNKHDCKNPREKQRLTAQLFAQLFAQLSAPHHHCSPVTTDPDMATLETLPRDVALHILRFALFPDDFDYASLSVGELKLLLKERHVSFDDVAEKHELVELARTSDAASGTEGDVNQRGVGRGEPDYFKPPTGATTKLPPSLEVPTLPPPEVFVPKRDAPQVPFDPVPVGVTFGLNAVKAAVHISTVSKERKRVVMDDTLWSAPLDALKKEFEAEKDPGTDKRLNEGLFAPPGSDKYRDPRHKESWDTLSVFNRYQVLLSYVKVLCEDFFKACQHNVCSLAEYDNGTTRPSLAREADSVWQNGGKDHLRGDKERPHDWYDAVFTDATVGRMVWNSLSPCLTSGHTGRDYWAVLLGGANAFENRTRYLCEDVPHELEKHGYIKRKPELNQLA